MSGKNSLSLTSAILININIMLGAGLFVNSISLSNILGILSPLIYIIVGLLMLPLVLSISKLLRYHSSGSFYEFANIEISKTAGFFASWTYFVGKLASATLNIHFFTHIAQTVIPILRPINNIFLDLIILGIFTVLNMLNMRTGSKIQTLFMILKIVPISFVFLSGGYFLFNSDPLDSYNNLSNLFGNIPASIPFAIYAFTGFEASCSLSKHIKDSKKNGPKAILISFIVTVLMSALYQLLFFISTNNYILPTDQYFQAIPTILSRFSININNLNIIKNFLQMFIASSALGGAYGILYSNSWNLHVLAKNKLVWGYNKIAELNKHHIAYLAIIIEAAICIVYLLITAKNNLILPQITALGCTLSYSISVLSYYFLSKKLNNNKTLPIFGLISCIIMLIFCIKSLVSSGLIPFLVFSGIMILGTIMLISNKANKTEAKL